MIAATFGRGMFSAALIADAFPPTSERTADRWLKEWRADDKIAACRLRGHYIMKEAINAVA